MKKSCLIKFLIVGLLSFVTIFPQINTDNKEYGKLTVVVTGFKNEKGFCRFAIDDSKFVYEREDTVFIGKVLPIIDKQVIVVIDSVEYGEYAIRVFHDENENEKIDTNFLGIPTERYGYSNDASSWFGPPSWDRAKFIFDQPEMLLEIKVDSFL
jgi:uncharacterized protein (DUF2141 family)